MEEEKKEAMKRVVNKAKDAVKFGVKPIKQLSRDMGNVIKHVATKGLPDVYPKDKNGNVTMDNQTLRNRQAVTKRIVKGFGDSMIKAPKDMMSDMKYTMDQVGKAISPRNYPAAKEIVKSAIKSFKNNPNKPYRFGDPSTLSVVKKDK